MISQAINLIETSSLTNLIGGDVVAEKSMGGIRSLKYKRRKVSANRDFPPNCGRNASRVNSNPKKNGDICTSGRLSKDSGCGASQVIPVPKRGDIVSGTRTFHNNVSVGNPQIKKDGVRGEPSFVECSGISVELGTFKTSERLRQTGSYQLLKALISETSHGSELMKVQEPLFADTLKVSSESMSYANQVKLETTYLVKNFDQAKPFDHIKCSNGTGSTYLLKNASQPEEKDPLSSLEQVPHSVLLEAKVQLKLAYQPEASDLVEAVKYSRRKQYPPRRRVSARRDFPLGVTNTQCYVAEGCQKSASIFQDPSGGNEKGSELNIIQKVVRDDFEQKSQISQDEDTLESRLVESSIITREPGDEAKVRLLETVEKEMVEHVHVMEVVETKLEPEDTDGTSIKSAHENVISQLNLKSISSSKEVAKGSKRTGGKLGKDSVKCSRDISLKKNLSGKSVKESVAISQSQVHDYVELEVSSDRVVVQAIMAASNCPWSLGKRSPKFSGGKKTEVEKPKEKYRNKKNSPTRNVSYEGACQLALVDADDYTRVDIESVKFGSGTSSKCKLPEKSVDESLIRRQPKMQEFVRLDTSNTRVIVQALMATSNSLMKHTSLPSNCLSSAKTKSKRIKHEHPTQDDSKDISRREETELDKSEVKLANKKKAPKKFSSKGTKQLVLMAEDERTIHDAALVQSSKGTCLKRKFRYVGCDKSNKRVIVQGLMAAPNCPWTQGKQDFIYISGREGLCVDDISQGKEKMPIGAMNTLDGGKPPPFTYISNMVYPSWYDLPSPEGCQCVDGCSDLAKCLCVVKNGGEIPFNSKGAILKAKPLVYECGPSCKCPPSCQNRVSQRGIKIQLEIFKTELRGWGVRALTYVPSGSFVCEYTGDLLQDKEAEERTSNDEYLFDIGHICSDHPPKEDNSSLIVPDSISSCSCESVDDADFAIDAAQCGSVGRFINHSCSPNLYAQNVLYDHSDKRIPHIMLFAAENIPPLQELSYDYNYKLDQVRDSDGNIKKKNCHCGSHECTGRLY